MGMTATQLGALFSRGAAAMNVTLRDHGFLEGAPGAWRPTELGKQFVTYHDHDNGYGGFAHRSWGWLSWDDGLVDALKHSLEANPNGILPAAPSEAVKTATAAGINPGGPGFGKGKRAVFVAVGLAALVAPVAKYVIGRRNDRSAATAEAAAAQQTEPTTDATDTVLGDDEGEPAAIVDPPIDIETLDFKPIEHEPRA